MRQFSVLSVGVLGLLACSSAQFNGQTPRSQIALPPPEAAPPPTPSPPAATPGLKDLRVRCLAPVATVPTLNLAAAPGDRATLSGELCPAAAGVATILFVIDYSGSMGWHRKDDGTTGTGNDPLVNGSCGRLAAAQTVLAAAAAAAGTSGSVRVGFVPFAGDVLADRVVALTPLSEFSSWVDTAHFCSYVAQEASDVSPTNPAAIDGRAVDASTNYAAAFSAAAQILVGIGAGNAAVTYFISDGEPTSGSADPVAGGIAAGQGLLASVPGLTLDGLLLGSDGAAAEGVLQAVVGSPDRVRVAANASQLAQEIVHFPGIALTDAAATITGADGIVRSLALASFAVEAGASGVWRFVTDAFALNPPGTATINIRAKTAAGVPVSGQALLKVTRM